MGNRKNILKNSIDAISESGSIGIYLKEDAKNVLIDFIDNGKGIKKSFFNEVFKPGFTSKNVDGVLDFL